MSELAYQHYFFQPKLMTAALNFANIIELHVNNINKSKYYIKLIHTSNVRQFQAHPATLQPHRRPQSRTRIKD